MGDVSNLRRNNIMRKIATSILVVAIMLVVSAASVSAEKYEVEKGDSLWSIAEEFQTNVDELVSLNDLKTTVIQPKQTIMISETYIVERGDTLSHIAKDYGVKVEQIKKWNDLESDTILIGEELVIKEAKNPTGEEKADEKSSEQVATNNESNEKSSEPVAANSENEEAEPVEQEANEENTQTTNDNEEPAGETFEVTATAYTAECDGCSGTTYTGVDLKANPNKKVIAVDPNVIPLGSKVYVEGYGYAVAEDIGGAIKGNKIDLHVPTKEEAYSWGVQTVNVTIVD